MKKISSLIFGLAFATVVAYSSPCTITTATASASTCTSAAGGSVVASTGAAQPYGFTGAPPTIGASYVETVNSGDAGNPFGATDDEYVLTLTNITGTGIEHVTLSNFGAASQIEVGFSGGTAATNITESGGIISFNFTPTELEAGPGPETLIVYTNTKTWNGSGTTGIIDGTAGSGIGFEPTVPTTAPEPMSMSLLGGGLALLGALRFRRK